MTLHERIREVVEERLRIARAANPSPWRRFVGRTGLNHLDPNTIFGDGEPRGFDKLRNVCNLDYSWERDANAEHIMANDPSDVILSAEHALSVLEDHRDDGTGECPTCIHDTAPGEGAHYDCRHWFVPHPCREIRRLATRWRVDVDG